jgi:RNA polymerase sigma factor (sigma-70 family)
MMAKACANESVEQKTNFDLPLPIAQYKIMRTRSGTKMTRTQSPTLVGHLKTLFGAGTLTGLGEGELLNRFLSQRDETAFEEILARHGPMVLGICRRWLADPHEVDDAFQAIFLILVRKAATLRDRNTLSNWLYGISLRVAQRARANTARRRAHEHQDADVLSMAQSTESHQTDHETFPILDEEIRRLPEKQQAAIVLCLVQGKTHEVAAAELGCPLGTIKSRVASGRAKLASRLSRRGLAPTVALATASPSENLLASSIPQELTRQTLDAAMRLAVCRSVPRTAVSASIQTLVQGVCHAILVDRIKAIVACVAATGVLASAATAFALARERAPSARESPVAPLSVAAADESHSKVDGHGDPLPAGASVRLGTVRHRQASSIHRIVYAKDGKFVVTDGEDRRMRLWNSDDGKLIRELDTGVDTVRDLVVIPDGTILATAGTQLDRHLHTETDVVSVTELATGKPAVIRAWSLPPGTSAVALSPDAKTLAAGNQDGKLKLLNARTPAERSSSWTVNPAKRSFRSKFRAPKYGHSPIRPTARLWPQPRAGTRARFAFTTRPPASRRNSSTAHLYARRRSPSHPTANESPPA